MRCDFVVVDWEFIYWVSASSRLIVCLGQSHWSRDKVKKAKFLVSAWRWLVRLGPPKHEVGRIANSAWQSLHAGQAAPVIDFPA